jgi:hypothetical protein
MRHAFRVEPILFPPYPRSQDVFARNAIAPEDLLGGPSTQELIAFIKGEPTPGMLTAAHEERVAEIQREVDELRALVCRLEDRETGLSHRIAWMEERLDTSDQELAILKERLDKAEDPDEVIARLAEIISHCDRLAPNPTRSLGARIAEEFLRIPLRGVMPPALIIGAFLGVQRVLAAVPIDFSNWLLVQAALAILASVPIGLTASTLLVRLMLAADAPIQRDDILRVGSQVGSVKRVSWRGVHLELEGLGERFLPYYLAMFYAIQRVREPENAASAQA